MNENMEEFASHLLPAGDYEFDDPYETITIEEGEPFTLEFDADEKNCRVHFNVNWNARFLRLREALYDSRQNRFFLMHRGQSECVSEFQVCRYLATELAVYWKIRHSQQAKYLLPRRDMRMLRDSVALLKGTTGC